jgi:integrase
MNLTQATVARLKLPDGKDDAIYFDDRVPGFGLRLRRAGSRTWVYQYKMGPVLRRMVLGRETAMKPEAARKIAEKHHAAVKEGRDPAAEKAVRTAQAANTIESLIRDYLEFQQSRLRPRSLVEVQRHLEVNAKKLHRLPVGTVDKTIVGHLIREIAKDKGVPTANRTRASLSALFTWGMKATDFVASNPVTSTHTAGDEKPRDRVLSDAEIKVLWAALEDDTYSKIVRVLLLTGQRLKEIGWLCWSEVEFDRNRIMLPPDRTKNNRAHHVPLSGTVRKILKDLRAESPDGQEFVFQHGNNGAFKSWAIAKEKLDARIAKLNGSAIPHWTLHDLRRTAATRMAEDLQIQPHVIEAVLNHVSGHKSGVAGVYNLATYAAEKENALTMWAEHVAAIAKGHKSNVTPIRRA